MKKLILLLIVGILGTAAQAQSLYGDMETWSSFTAGNNPVGNLESVKGWHCPDSLAFNYNVLIGPTHRQLFKTTDAHSGSFAAKIITAEQGILGFIPGILTNANISVDISNSSFATKGGTSITQRVNYVNAWIKYMPKGGDTARVVANAIIVGGKTNGDDSVLGTATQNFAATPAYTLVSIPIIYTDPNSMPDAIQVGFFSSGDQATDSSTLYVDDVTYTVYPVAINTVSAEHTVSVYPNPASSYVIITGNIKEQLMLHIINTTGQLINKEIINGSAKIDVSLYSNGLYYYSLINDIGEMVQRGRFTVSK